MPIFLRNLLFTLTGAVILIGVWAKHRLLGYRKPNTVSADDRDARIDYVHDVVQSWLRFLPPDVSVRGRSVLELGPGSSLATGALLLAHGAQTYTAVDAFALAADETAEFPRDAIACFNGDLKQDDIEIAQAALQGASSNFQYHVDAGFNIPALCQKKTFDLILSCAAFEHFDAIETTIDGLTKVARSSCVSLHIVDLQTHTNAIRQRDPNNIYRFPTWLYSLLAFPGQPNRKRPIDYVHAFERNGWVDVHVIAAKSIPEDQRKKLIAGLAKPFDTPEMDMHMLDAVVISRYP
ncbi:class I SAM-dependent methyltransferase [Agrobacterium rosae]|uniref:class I SAM-dependent methyltransferase n=1 Tax=Agrobacterium rosae TaxID=1972867 RepID=UPI003A7F63AA